MTKKELEKRIINNEEVKPFYPNWEEFAELKGTPGNFEEYKEHNRILYNDLILWKIANGETKEQVKQFLIDKINTISNYKGITKYEIFELELLTELLNKYFSLQPTETKEGILNNKKVMYSWNKILKYELIKPNEVYNKYQLKIDIEDWTNHKINGQKTGKFLVDHKGNIFNIRPITA